MALKALFAKRVVLVRIEANLAWEVFRDPETQAWVGVCQPLNLNAVGDTWGEFFESAQEAIELLLTDLLEEGELPAFLQRHGWRLESPLPKSSARVQWDVPFGVLKRARFEDLVP